MQFDSHLHIACQCLPNTEFSADTIWRKNLIAELRKAELFKTSLLAIRIIQRKNRFLYYNISATAIALTGAQLGYAQNINCILLNSCCATCNKSIEGTGRGKSARTVRAVRAHTTRRRASGGGTAKHCQSRQLPAAAAVGPWGVSSAESPNKKDLLQEKSN